MKLKHLPFFLALTLCANAFAQSDLSVSKVQSKISSAASDNLSLIVDFNYTGAKPLNDWRFGFYMPRTFLKLGTSINPKLDMKVCEFGTSHCSELKTIRRSSAYPHVYADGTSTVLIPESNFEIQPNHQYQVSITHSNQAAPANLSAMPQSFFLADNNKIINANVPLSAYGQLNSFENIGGYHAGVVTGEIEQHKIDNWNNSLPLNHSLATQLHLVPMPKSITEYSPTARMPLLGRALASANASAQLGANLRSVPLTVYNQFVIQDFHLFNYQTSTSSSNANVKVLKDPKITNPEGYDLTILNNQITIKASNTAGAYYGLVTLAQLLSQPSIPALHIVDAPRFHYRGILLDSARHFFSVSDVKKLIDVMAAHKLNTLHMHLSDDEGWRLALYILNRNTIRQSSSRGFLDSLMNIAQEYTQSNTDISNYKNFTPTFNPDDLIVKQYPHANTDYAGFYTRADIKDIIHYANEHFITVIPEVDFPGHANALVQADPVVFNDPNDQSDMLSVQGYYHDVIPVCTYHTNNQFTNTMKTIVSEINTLFASQTTAYAQQEVSVGGDEVSADAWTNDSSCQGKWAGLTALGKSHYFFNLLQKDNPEIKLSGWQQFVQNNDGTIGSDAVKGSNSAHVWVWDGSKTGIPHAISLAENNYHTVLSFSDDLYFDLTYTPDAFEPGFNWAGSYLDTHAALMSSVHASDVLAQLDDSHKQYIDGLEGALWGENMMNFHHLMYMALPKMAGLAEAAWSPSSVTNQEERVDWQSLAMRLGKDNNGFLGFINSEFGVKYRGFPNGIGLEVPQS